MNLIVFASKLFKFSRFKLEIERSKNACDYYIGGWKKVDNLHMIYVYLFYR